MSDDTNSIKRRTVLKGVGASSAGALAYTGTVSGGEPADSGPLLSDLRAQNSAVEAVTFVTRFFEAGSTGGGPVEEIQTPRLVGLGATYETDLSLDGGTYTVRTNGRIESGEPATAETTLQVPDGGVPDYTAIVVRASGPETVEVDRVEI
ncbi:MAG: hypothetical protein ABEI99_10870 [Halobaculum sp.]